MDQFTIVDEAHAVPGGKALSEVKADGGGGGRGQGDPAGPAVLPSYVRIMLPTTHDAATDAAATGDAAMDSAVEHGHRHDSRYGIAECNSCQPLPPMLGTTTSAAHAGYEAGTRGSRSPAWSVPHSVSLLHPWIRSVTCVFHGTGSVLYCSGRSASRPRLQATRARWLKVSRLAGG